MYSMLKDSNPKAAKMSVDIMIELYKKNIWNDAKTVNVIATVGCFSNVTKVNSSLFCVFALPYKRVLTIAGNGRFSKVLPWP